MTKTREYPTWHRVNASLIISEEQQDGTPDFYVSRDKERGVEACWRVKWRTSAHWSGPYKTAAEAMQAVEADVDRRVS